MKYKITYISANKYGPVLERTCYIDAKDKKAAQNVFKKEFKNCVDLTCTLVEEHK